MIEVVKVKAFEDITVEGLERSINNFIYTFSKSGEFECIDVKYAIAHEVVATSRESAIVPVLRYTALLVYKLEPGF